MTHRRVMFKRELLGRVGDKFAAASVLPVTFNGATLRLWAEVSPLVQVDEPTTLARKVRSPR